MVSPIEKAHVLVTGMFHHRPSSLPAEFSNIVFDRTTSNYRRRMPYFLERLLRRVIIIIIAKMKK
jgi:hypothetical protein